MFQTPEAPAPRGGGVGWPALVLALCLLAGCARQQGPTGPFPEFSEFQGDEVRRVGFSGDLRFSRDSLRAVVRTRASRCRFLFIPVCVPFTSIGRDVYRLDLNELARDVARLQLYHRDHGFYATLVDPLVHDRGDDEVGVEFVIDPGRQVVLRDLTISGTEPVLEPEDLLAIVPLRENEPFGRAAFFASADTIRNQLLRRGHAYADVLRNYALDTIAGVAEAEFIAIPGPVVYIDTIIFQGNERLSERTLRRHITVSEGQVLRAVELGRTQRNLYNLDMVNFASVRLAPDTLQENLQPERATVLVQVVEAAQYAVEASAGFGTVECFRSNGRWVNRNFIGGGRRLELIGSLSRIGVGSPTDIGLERGICSALGEEAFFGGLEGIDVRDRIDYRVAANFQQPSIFGTQNQLAVNLHSERLSESEAYIRESSGGRVTAVRQLDRGPLILTTTAEIQNGRTIASPAILCVGFDTCTEEDLDRLSRSRWSNSLSLAAVQDRTRTDGVATRGYIARGSMDFASPIFGSDDNYLRLTLEGARYQRVGRDMVLATNLRLGRFLRGVLGPESGYIPPERRFYAGGPNSVRGFVRNALGPTAYVIPNIDRAMSDTIGSATGGTQMIVGSVELRMPSPWMADVTRLAVFLDAGHVSAPGSELFEMQSVRVTPGVGIRFLTPVGPFRLDVAYNPYPPETGPLYLVEPRAGLILIDSAYQPDSPGFLGRLKVQFALGQAF